MANEELKLLKNIYTCLVVYLDVVIGKLFAKITKW